MGTTLVFPLTQTLEIDNLDDVRKWFAELNSVFGLSWHPDDPFGFGEEPEEIEEAARLDALMDKAFDVCDAAGVEIYALGLEVNKELRHSFGIGTDYET